MGLQEKRAHNVGGSANKTLGFSILGRSVGAGEAIDNAVGGEEGTERGVDEFAAIVTLHALDHHAKLGMNKCKEAL